MPSSETTAAASTLSGPAYHASRAALSAALSEQRSSLEAIQKEDSPEPGEIQEVDMQAQVETIRTVFNDPTNFNVKVVLLLCRYTSEPNTNSFIPLCSILSTLRGLYGLIHPRLKVVTCRRLLYLRSHKRHSRKLLVWQPPRAGWKISRGSSVLIV